MREGGMGAVPSAYVTLLFEYIDRLGVGAAALLGEERPQVGPLGSARYPIARWRKLLEGAAAALNDPLLGLKVGRTITPRHVGVLGYVALACKTLGGALERYGRYEGLFYDETVVRTRVDGEVVVLEWDVRDQRYGLLVDSCAIGALAQFARDITAQELLGTSVDFVYTAPPEAAEYERHFRARVRFEQPKNALAIPLAYLDAPLRSPDPLLLQLLEQQAEALLARADEGGVEQEVRRAIARLVRDGEPSLEAVAAELGTSTRTLHRRLEERGASFRALLEDTRRRLAEDYLGDRGLQLSEIAQLLGFSEQSAFSRAFKRWTGTTPLRWRAASPRRPAGAGRR